MEELIDYPILSYKCKDAPDAVDCRNPSCEHRQLVVTAYAKNFITPGRDGIKKELHPLPTNPDPVYGIKCLDHLEKDCSKGCTTWIQSVIGWDVCEWNPAARAWGTRVVSEIENLKHGYWSRAEQRRREQEKRKWYQNLQRKQRAHPYLDPENSRARKSISAGAKERWNKDNKEVIDLTGE